MSVGERDHPRGKEEHENCEKSVRADARGTGREKGSYTGIRELDGLAWGRGEQPISLGFEEVLLGIAARPILTVPRRSRRVTRPGDAAGRWDRS